jgi:PAS domain S-box-containing protein
MTSSIAPSTRPEALTVLLEASSLLLNAASEDHLLAQALDLASNLLVADAYGVWRETDSPDIWKLIAQRGLSSSYPAVANRPPARFYQSDWAVEDVATDDRLVFSKPVYAAEGIRSVLVLPLTRDTVVNGAIVYYWRRPHQFTPNDVDYARALSNLAAAALNHLELHERHRREQQRLAFVAQASAELASSLDYHSTFERVARLAVTQIAEWCTVHIAEDGEVTRLALAHADPAMAPLAELYEQRYPEQISTHHGVGKVIATGVPEIVSPITDEMIQAAAKDEEHLRMLQQFQFSASIVVPLQSQGKVLGAIRLLGTGGHHFNDSDVQLALDLGRRAAVAIENARLHRALLEQDTELRLSHTAARMGSWSWDLEHNKLFWSSEFKALHGLPQEIEPTEDKSYDLVHPDDRDRSKREFWATVHSEATVFNSEHRSLTPDGRVLWLQVRGRIRRTPNGKAVWIAGLIIDVTESRLAEQALRRAEKLAAAGRLAATVAHEVNNPLASVINLIYLAKHAEGLPADAAQHLHVAEEELGRIAQIVRQTLGFYRESTSPKRTGIVALVSGVLSLYRPRAISRGLVLAELPHSCEEVYTSIIAGEMKQVLSNLIANAIDATPEHGSILTSVQSIDGCVEIAIADTGSGISEASRKHLFEPFFTTKEDVGTGLGLWVSKGIVEKHGGSIFIDPAVIQGTTVRVRIPIQP